MSAQGPKHASEHTTQDTKRERRRGAAGRAAALRRAPSDSDCSGETASLSADSAERRPAPPPPRSGKTRRYLLHTTQHRSAAPSDSDCSGETASLSADSAERRPAPPPPRSGKTRRYLLHTTQHRSAAPSDSDCSGETASLSADSAERRPAPPPPRSGKTRRYLLHTTQHRSAAPSDSDCSGETASLSADSAERRPAPPPPRSGKTRRYLLHTTQHRSAAPSDSDCSGETASLSADSAERRPAPPPPRSGKTRRYLLHTTQHRSAAPSDSDCSGETASLSADSAERRPAPPPPRSGKTRRYLLHTTQHRSAAPSDSDCSGETASLSADSAERRPAPPPPRSGKTRRYLLHTTQHRSAAPSDSDCSGETASLSADSAERRPAPPPPRSGKTRRYLLHTTQHRSAAPSDSDCSGETASLSADSAERRPAPPPPRSGKTRRYLLHTTQHRSAAPSDSDCSGETASLSADSAERRPAPPPPRSGKTRSRRRGSEWEVLEGLKDGQRFERRPEVFNGYLHKKRKWPLKGWHKRFFVVDGGILVYARSPTDVARGRLHGSLDVGLSVISAKPRRRRIDIDADEFIYHLRAKTPDVFRTWLNVLKAHRLYRQHLLTFGARESVPKIHAPLDELPPTETSSHISHSSRESFSSVSTTLSSTSQTNPIPLLTGSPTFRLPSSKVASSVYENKSYNILKDWNVTKKPSSLLPFELEPIDVDKLEMKCDTPPIIKHGSLCSMCCVEKRIQITLKQDPLNSNEKQMHSSNLDIRILKCPDSSYNSEESPVVPLVVEGSKYMEPFSEESPRELTSERSEPNFDSSLLGEYTLNTGLKGSKVSPINVKHSKNPLVTLQSFCKEKSPALFGDKTRTAMFFLGRRKCSGNIEDQWMMKRSRKSTNLCKYRNSIKEPLLKRPFSKCMLLGRYKLDSPLPHHRNTKEIRKNRSVICDILPNDYTQDKIPQENKCIQNSTDPKESKSIQDITTSSEYDSITEKLILTLFDKNSSYNRNVNNKTDSTDETDAKFFVNEVVKELYNVQLAQCESQPVKFLFKSLLHFWLKNTRSEILRHSLLQSRSTGRQSFQCFTKDAKLSSELIKSEAKETQVFEKNIEVVKWENKAFNVRAKLPGKTCKPEKKKTPDQNQSPRPDTDSFEKERRIQELERLLKNTVYICETVRSSQSREKDIKITKTLIQNLEKLSKKSVRANLSDDREISDSSAEIPRMQETINRLISDTDLPPEIAKEFLNVYLDVLLHNSSRSATSTSQSSDNSKMFSKIGDGLPIGEVQAEAVQRKVSKSITTTTFEKIEKPSFNGDDQNKSPSVDPGQLYLKDMLDKITSIFSRVQKNDSKLQQNLKDKNAHEKKETPVIIKAERSSNNNYKQQLIYENKDENSVVIDLSKFDLEHISMVNDATSTGVSITINLKEKPADFGEWKRKNLSLKFSNDRPKAISINNSVPWPVHTSALKQTKSHINMKNPYVDFDPNFPKDKLELKPYLSPSDATSKANFEALPESDSFCSFKNSDVSTRLSPSKSMNGFEDAQCYLLSSFKKVVPEVNIQDNKKMRLKELNIPVKTRQRTPDKSRKPPGMTVFEKPPPRIIDEKFILLLLENLTLLSKNIPGIYKDINSLYLKLRKRHEKIIKNSSFAPGLSLLGKIYDEESGLNLRKPMFDEITQYDESICPEEKKDCMKDAVPIAVNTSLLIPTIPNVVDKSLSAYELSKTLASFEVQTESCFKNKQINKTPIVEKLSAEKAIDTQTSLVSLETINDEASAITERAVSIQNWYRKLTEESAVSTCIKCLFEKDNLTQNFRIAPPESKVKISHEEPITPKKSLKKQSAKARQDLIKEIKLLSPSFKVSTQSQTIDKKALRHLHCLVKDFKVYKMETSNLSYVTRSGSVTESNVAPHMAMSDELRTLYRCSSNPSFCSGLISPTAPPIRGPQAGFVTGTPGGRLAGWIIESGGPLESASRELGQAQLSVQQLQRLLDALEIQQMHHDTDQVSLEGASPNVKKDRRKFGLRKKKSNSKCASIDLAPPHVDTSTSHMALSTLTAPPSPGGGASSMPNSAASLPIACAAARPQSLPGAEALAAGGPASLPSLTPDHQLREDFTVLAKDLVASLKTIVSTLVCERGRLRAAMDAGDAVAPPAAVAALRTNLSSALQQNSELRSRLSRIHDASDLAEISSVGNNSDQQTARQFPQSNSYSSSCVSASEFFDAEEHELKPAEIIATDEAGVIELDGDSSSEAGSLSSEEGSASSDNSDGATSAVIPAERPLQNGSEQLRSRRARLPCPRPTPASPSLWNLLYKNIGKDLSQISMPVTINEPLNMLQRLCEELEYSELLDAAAECGNELDRMSLIAAFAVSAYAASAHRAASKPFNPLLAETYECVRPDRDFRFIAEQVSHHPPISACHAESPRWTFWQEARIKTKFWGKSMEFQPTGRVHVRLARTGDHYSWNKVTTCVHNLFGGQRWVDQYGDMHIVCHGTDITCKLNFIKASSWSSGRHEVRGAVLVGGQSRARLAGRWSEGLHAGERPLWRPGAMPQDYELYYGFTRFAMELNELEPGMREILPHTDTRLRPDQRALEEGDVDAAEQFKHELEQSQRERRRDGLEHRAAWFRKTVEDGEETWVFTGEYWKAREAGFSDAPRLW